jgi:hypothetical protein
MKVFISWSGDQSRAIASVIYEWLPMVLQSVEPYMSEETEKGVRWSSNIGAELEKTDYGIICLTRQNIEAPWIHFEAGALAKSMDGARVAPILFGLKKSDVQGPLSQFQLTNFDENDVRRLLTSMNSFKPDDALDEGRLQKVFRALWKELEENTNKAIQLHKVTAPPPAVSTQDILEELLSLARNQYKAIRSFELADEIVARVSSAIGNRDSTWPDPSHRVWHDLFRRWDMLRSRVFGLSADVIDGESWRTVRELVDRLSGPMDYLIMRNEMNRKGPTKLNLAKGGADPSDQKNTSEDAP